MFTTLSKSIYCRQLFNICSDIRLADCVIAYHVVCFQCILKCYYSYHPIASKAIYDVDNRRNYFLATTFIVLHPTGAVTQGSFM